MSSRRFPAIGLAALGSGGLLVGHVLDYVVAIPDPAHRHALLAESGHGYLPWATHVVGVVLIFGAALLVGAGFARGSETAPIGFRATASRLVPLQAVAFVILEVLERVLVGATLVDLAGPLLWVGLIVQVVVALACAGLAALLWRTGAGLAAALARPQPGREATTARCPETAVRPPDTLRRLRLVRGPPVLLSR